MIRAATCFSGIGAPEVALPDAHWLWHAEVEPFPSAVMAVRHPASVNLGDVLADDFLQRASAFGRLDLLVGGPPCQAFSVAGLRRGMADDRGNLSLRWVQICHAIRPRNAVTENVPGWLSMPDNAFGCFLGGLVGADAPLVSTYERGRWPDAGLVAGPEGRAAWRVLDAQYFGVAQRRRRVFVVADFGDGADPVEVLFERLGLHGNSAPSRKARERAAPTIGARTQGGGGLGTDFDLDGGFIPQGYEGTTAPTLNAAFGSKLGLDNQHIDSGAGLFVAHPLPAEGFDASEDRTGRGTPIVPVAYRTSGNCGAWPVGEATDAITTSTDPFSHVLAFTSKDSGGDATADMSSTLRSMGHADSHANGGGQVAVAFDLRGREGGAQFEGPHNTANIRAASGGSSRSYVAGQWAVRRLTPTECARLQGFPDTYLDITFRNRPAADGNKYKALGNSMAVPCVGWVLARIAGALDAERSVA